MKNRNNYFMEKRMSAYKLDSNTTRGFTLIELSIVLVIIGLIVGGVLVGQDLIRAAEVRATISQIEKYNTAVNTFRGKYNALPGDMNASTATAFGFTARGANPGTGDGNGVVEGPVSSSAANGYMQGGETTLFWQDLSVGNPSTPMNINLVDGSFNQATSGTATTSSTVLVSSLFPAAKLGRGNSIYVYSTNGTNYYGISNVSAVAAGVVTSSVSMTVQQAYQIDKKTDDGYPITGNVTAVYNTGALTENGAAAPTSHASAAGAGTIDCYDSTTTPNYALSVNNGAGANCALSFRFQ